MVDDEQQQKTFHLHLTRVWYPVVHTSRVPFYILQSFKIPFVLSSFRECGTVHVVSNIQINVCMCTHTYIHVCTYIHVVRTTVVRTVICNTGSIKLYKLLYLYSYRCAQTEGTFSTFNFKKMYVYRQTSTRTHTQTGTQPILVRVDKRHTQCICTHQCIYKIQFL